MRRTKVSVCMITYGHEKYIRSAIEGVLMQQSNYEIELILANDCSPDATDAIIQNILATHPKASCIKYFKHKKNLGIIPNFIFAIQKCQGEYVALCDGDDYWIDPLKLQKQVDFLEANTEYLIHSGNAKIYTLDALTDKTVFDDIENKTYDAADFYLSNNLVTCSVMFRNINLKFPTELSKVIFGDWFFYVLILISQENAKAYRSLEILSVYRQHSEGVMGSMTKINYIKNHIDHLVLIKKITKYSKDIVAFKKKLNDYCISCFRLQVDNGKYIDALKIFILNLRYSGFELDLKKYISKVKNDFKI